MTNTMTVLSICVLVAIVVAGFSGLLFARERRSERLRRKFGRNEYARAVNESGNRRHAEARLEARPNHVARTRM